MFTGDSSGNFLFPALYRAGFANQPGSASIDDGMSLSDIFITAICRCAPPGNKPTPAEQANCVPYLQAEMEILQPIHGIVALGRIAFDQARNILLMKNKNLGKMEFSHGAFYEPGQGLPWLLASFHPSRQNTQTGRLTTQMFDNIWQTASNLIAK
jgi:uracil-DNA glycosylase family 4